MRINKLTLLLLAPMCLFSCNKGVSITILNENEEIGDVSKGGNFNPGSTLILDAKVKDDKVGKYLFKGWYKVDGEHEYGESFQNPWIFKVPNNSVTYKAKWQEYSTQQFIFNHIVDANSYSVSNYYGSDKQIIVPSTHYDLPVIRISAYAFAGLKSADSIKIHDGIISIGEYAFMNSNLKEITLPKELKADEGYVAENIFYGWNENQTIYIPKECFMNESSNRTKWGWDLEPITEGSNILKEQDSSSKTSGSKTVHFQKIN